MRDKTVYQYEIKNTSPKNPNSCVEVIHAYMMDEDYNKSAILRIMTQLMAQPTFYQLRTVEQLGYVVKASLFSYKRMQHFSILVQSSNKNADFLEHRVNEYLESYLKKEVFFEEKDFETVRQSLINKLKQKDMSIAEEASSNWASLSREDLNFDSKEQLCAAYE